MLIAAAYRKQSCLHQCPLESTERSSSWGSCAWRVWFPDPFLGCFLETSRRDAARCVFFSGPICSPLTAARYNLACCGMLDLMAEICYEVAKGCF